MAYFTGFFLSSSLAAKHVGSLPRLFGRCLLSLNSPIVGLGFSDQVCLHLGRWVWGGLILQTFFSFSQSLTPFFQVVDGFLVFVDPGTLFLFFSFLFFNSFHIITI